MDKRKFYDAVDVVCMECFFGEEVCETCPVRKVVDRMREKEETKKKDDEIKLTILRGMFQ